MTALDDPEDGNPSERSSIPPAPLEHFEESPQEAPTLPPPPVDEALASAIAGMVLESLLPRVDAIDVVAGSAMNCVTNAAEQVERMANAMMGLAAEIRTLSTELAQHRAHTLEAYDRLGGRVVRLEDWRRERTGEDDGSISAAAVRGGGSVPPGE